MAIPYSQDSSHFMQILASKNMQQKKQKQSEKNCSKKNKKKPKKVKLA